MKRVNLPYLISKKLTLGDKAGFTSTIIKIAIGTIALSLAVMLISSAVISGFKNQIQDKIFGFWGHIHITDANINRTFELNPIKDAEAFRDSITNIAQISYQVDRSGQEGTTLGGVRHIQSYILVPGIIRTKKSSMEGIILKGIAKDYDWDNLSSYLKSGEVLSVDQDEISRDILISDQSAKRLELTVGDKINVNFVRNRNRITKAFWVKGIYRTGLEEYDKKFAFIDQRMVQQILEWNEDQIAGYEVILDDFDDAEVIADYIYDELLPRNQYAETIDEKFPNIFEWLELQNINETIILLLMILVSIINMATALLILILERSRMIGVLKVLGETDWNIQKIFLYHAAYIIGIGLIIGNFIGLGFCLLQKYTGLVQLDEQNYYLSTAPIEISIPSILMINLGTILITMLFLVIPSYLVTKINVIKVLRFN